MSEKSDDDTSTDALATVVTDALGFPVPPSVVKRLVKAFGMIITGVAEIPAAWLQGKAQAIRDDTQGRSLVSRRAAEAAVERFGSDPQLVERAVEHYGARIIREQQNREAVVRAALEELKANPPTADEPEIEISDDWLDMYSRVAEQRSDEDMRLYLAKILAAEIRSPGSFEPSTIQVLATLTPRVAQLFQKFCNISSTSGNQPYVIVAPYGPPGVNALESLGLRYFELTELQDAGLIQGDFNAWRAFNGPGFCLGSLDGMSYFKIASVPTCFTPTPDTLQEEFPVTCLNFTAAGTQLRRIVHIEPNVEYVRKLTDWIVTTFKVRSLV